MRWLDLFAGIKPWDGRLVWFPFGHTGPMYTVPGGRRRWLVRLAGPCYVFLFSLLFPSLMHRGVPVLISGTAALVFTLLLAQELLVRRESEIPRGEH